VSAGHNSVKEVARSRMTVDIVKQLDRAKRFVEKSRLDEAIEAYESVLASFPNHLESIQSLGDLYTLKNQPDRAAVYYGMIFDRFVSPREDPKALALYTRFLKAHQQPPERVSRYALLLQKQNRAEEAIEQFTSAAFAFDLGGKPEEALACFVRIAQLDPESRDRHVAVAEFAERLGNSPAAARGYLRAGQLSANNDMEALDFFARAHKLMPNDRSTALLFAQGLLRNGQGERAAALLVPLAETEKDTAFLDTYADALMQSGQLDEARNTIEHLTNQGAGSAEKFFNLIHQYMRGGQEEKAVDLLVTTKKSMVAARRESEFASAVDTLVSEFPKSLRLAEFWCAMYGEFNREVKYFDALVFLFDLYMANDRITGACESLERLVEIDPYDAHNQERLDLLQGKADPTILARLKTRLSNVATHSAPSPQPESSGPKAGEISPVILEDVRAAQSLEDLLVQAEIFVQYSLQSKAVERLQKIVELFSRRRGAQRAPPRPV